MSIDKLIEKEREKFWNQEKERKKENEGVFDFAVRRAYEDMQPRTITGHNKISASVKDIQEELKEKFIEYFKGDIPESKEVFYEKHHELCSLFLDEINNLLRKNNLKLLAYGKAQKVVNMTFKYLYCCIDECDELKDKKEWFRYCHMPLDRFSLEWIYRRDKGIKRKQIESWSKLTEEEYQNIKNIVESYCKEPLQLDFIVWPRMQQILALEAFEKAFKEDQPTNDADSTESDNEPEEYESYSLNNVVISKWKKVIQRIPEKSALKEELQRKLDEIK